MRINNPKLFNGDLLATKKQITTWLTNQDPATENFTGLLSDKVIPISGIVAQNTGNVSGMIYPIYADTIKMSGSDSTKISEAITSLSTAIGNVKTYAVSGSNAINVTPDGGTAKEVFTVGLTLDGNSLTNTTSGLKVTDGYVSGIVDQNILNNLTIVRTTEGIASGNTAEYTLKYNGNPIPGASTINIPKDQFLKDVQYNSSTKKLTFTFNVEDGQQITDIDLGGLIDTYNAASGITKTLVNNVDTFVGVVDTTNSDPYLTVGANGFKLTGVSARFDGIDDDIEYLSGAVDYVSSFVSGLPNDITDVNNDVAYISSFVSGLPTDISNVESDVSYVSSFVSGLPTDISNVESDVSYVSSFVSGLPTDISNVENEISYVSSFVSGLPTDISNVESDVDYISSFVSGLPTDIDYVSGIVSGHTEDIDYISGVVTGIVDQVQSTNKFVSATVINTNSAGIEDTLYYTLDGQTAIYDNGGWRTISMEAITSLTGTVNDTTTATSQAIKSYVSGEITPVRNNLTTVSGDLDALEDTVSGIETNLTTVSGDLDALEDSLDTALPKKAEIFTVDKPFGSSTNAVVTGRVIAVYAKTTTTHSNAGDQVYPEINYTSGISTISASDLSAAETFTIVYVTATEQQGQ